MLLQSAGILLYRRRANDCEVLLVHPGGPYFAHKDAGAWSIPKGLIEDGEDGLVAARREFAEELGSELTASTFIRLQPVRQKGGKIVHAWAAEGNLDVRNIKSNTFRLEYPYKSGRWIDVPEVDRAEWFDLEQAAVRILPAQLPFLTALAGLLGIQQ